MWTLTMTEAQDTATAELETLRATIDNIDAAIIHMLAERFRCTRKIGRLKAKYEIPPKDPARELKQVTRLRNLASEAALDPDFAELFHAFVVSDVVRQHQAIVLRADNPVLT
jgi:chorismate mutase